MNSFGKKFIKSNNCLPSPIASAIPIVFLVITIITLLILYGADAIDGASQLTLIAATIIALFISRVFYPCSWKLFKTGILKSSNQILPAIPILICIATVSATWMLSGVVPTLINYGLELLSPKLFLFITCIVCAIISVLTGSSWTTCATIGIAFMGLGKVIGFNEAWIA